MDVQNPKPLQTIRDVRRREEMSLRTLQRRLGGVHMNVVRKLDNPESDMRLSDLYLVADAIGVPACELLTGANAHEVQKLRGLLVRIAKVANTLQRRIKSPPLKRLAESLKALIDEELPSDGIGEVPRIGVRRSQDELGKAAEFVATDPSDTDHWINHPALREGHS